MDLYLHVFVILISALGIYFVGLTGVVILVFGIPEAIQRGEITTVLWMARPMVTRFAIVYFVARWAIIENPEAIWSILIGFLIAIGFGIKNYNNDPNVVHEYLHERFNE